MFDSEFPGEIIDLEVGRRRNDRNRVTASLMRFNERTALGIDVGDQSLVEYSFANLRKFFFSQPDQVSRRFFEKRWETRLIHSKSKGATKRRNRVANVDAFGGKLVAHKCHRREARKQCAVHIEKCADLRTARPAVDQPGEFSSRCHFSYSRGGGDSVSGLRAFYA